MGKRNIIKIIMVGDGSVGKTSLRRRYMGDTFTGNYMMTIGSDFSIKRLGGFLIQLYDLAGQPGFKMLRKQYYLGAQAAIVVYDITKPQSLDNVRKWLDEITMAQGHEIPFVLVGNKIDLRSKSVNGGITSEQGKKFADILNSEISSSVYFVETSALTGEKVDLMFNTIINHLTGEDELTDGNTTIIDKDMKKY